MVQGGSNDAAHHLVAGSADQGGSDVIAETQDESEQASRANPRHGERKIDAPERIERASTERTRRAHVGWGYSLHDTVDRQQGERQLDVDHRGDRAETAKDQFERGLSEMEELNEIVDRTIVLQQHEPGSGSNQEGSPERHENEYQQDIRQALRRVRQDEGDRVGQNERDERHQGADIKRP